MSDNLKNWFKEKEEYKFKSKNISQDVLSKLEETAKQCRGDIMKMTTVAGSGHPGGSMSSIDIYTAVYSLADIPNDEIVVSHGHTSPGVYSILGRLGILDTEEILAFFRHISGPYEGHVESHLPGIIWSTGNLGQGLSAACGFAMAKKLKKDTSRVFALMSDAEQAKGQVAEGRRFASKFKLNNLTVVIDDNNRQISGKVEDIMPINIKEDYLADGWKVLEVCGHDIKELYEAIHTAINDTSTPYAILGDTIMCKGASFIEGNESYHGKALSMEELDKALGELGIENDTEKYIQKRASSKAKPAEASKNVHPLPNLNLGNPIEYKVGEKAANRDVYGTALAGPQMGEASMAFDFDLFVIGAGSGGVRAARIAAQRSQRANCLKQIGLAILNFHDTYKRFPLAVHCDEAGRPLSSWRFHITPFAAGIMRDYDHAARWDDQRNEWLTSKPFDIYCFRRNRPVPECLHTNVVAITGPGTVFDGDRECTLADIDSEDTILAIEIAESGIHWAAPGDLAIDEITPTILEGLDGYGVQVLFANEAVRFVSAEVPLEDFKKLLTIEGAKTQLTWDLGNRKCEPCSVNFTGNLVVILSFDQHVRCLYNHGMVVELRLVRIIIGLVP